MSLILDGSPPDDYWNDDVAACETWGEFDRLMREAENE